VTYLTIVPTPTDTPFALHMVWDGTDDEVVRPREATLDDLRAAWASVWGELRALELETGDLFVVQGFRYLDYKVATVARAKVQHALCNRLDLIETAIAHAGGVQ
jgi:hypothetical protein